MNHVQWKDTKDHDLAYSRSSFGVDKKNSGFKSFFLNCSSHVLHTLSPVSHCLLLAENLPHWLECFINL